MTEINIENLDLQLDVPGTVFPELNVHLLEQTIKWAEHTSGTEGHPAWNQANWSLELVDASADWSAMDTANIPKGFCGTAYCACGYGLQVTDNLQRVEGLAAFEPKEVLTNDAGEQFTPLGEADLWTESGAFVFGFTINEARAFFFGANQLKDLKRLARSFAHKRGVHIDV